MTLLLIIKELSVFIRNLITFPFPVHDPWKAPKFSDCSPNSLSQEKLESSISKLDISLVWSLLQRTEVCGEKDNLFKSKLLKPLFEGINNFLVTFPKL